ncbi:MAG: hypothetical protein DRP09_13425 [Candidatus Thorarchaeota archaeon]|nr:MAG: hypothetical protein DRP09_13425 [Candidatus Thorarchaeota archaeon]
MVRFLHSLIEPSVIVSDGDLDGILSVGLLLRYLDSVGVSLPFTFPRPGSLHELTVENAILVELGMTRGLRFRGKNILIDHHESLSGIYLFNESQLKDRIVEYDDVNSVADILVRYLWGKVPLDHSTQELVDTVGQIDGGRYETSRASDLHHAYAMNISSEEMRHTLVELVRSNRVDEIWGWVESESSRWVLGQSISSMLVDSAVELVSDVGLIMADLDDNQEVGVRNAMLQLENRYKIVISLFGTQENDWTVRRGSIGTKNPSIDLSMFYEWIRERGIAAGGRPSVGGFQFQNPQPVDSVLKLLREAIGVIHHDI